MPPAGTGAGTWWRPAAGATWQWQLTGRPDLSAGADVYDLDAVDTDAATVAAVHAAGGRAICYVETGAWEAYRPDASAYPASVLGKGVEGYPAERYVDVRRLDVLRPIIAARLELCRRKGFDGVEPDLDDTVVDAGPEGIGLPVTYADQVAFDRMVIEEAHARGLAIGLKNGTFGDDAARLVADLEPEVDFAVSEECVASGDICRLLAPFVAHGKPVFHAEYLDDYPGASRSSAARVLDGVCRATRPLGFSTILKDASGSLSAWRRACP